MAGFFLFSRPKVDCAAEGFQATMQVKAGGGDLMGKGHFLGGSTTGTYDEDGTPRFDEGPEFPLKKGPIQKRWSERAEVDQGARSAAKRYRNLVSTFLAKCAVAFRSDHLTASSPKPPSELKPEILSWGGNIAWIDKHSGRKSQFAKFVLNQGWTPDPPSK